ncbi:KGG domain-containing protein [Ramlibacter pallidus]|uniref:Uncharacterized protein n=1 Tax=Ramlibacter pallidus TaxID=2780087 RepID=A0ABR9S002_9BURK|nr:KGG domain-containing protein [Ramlibacter pallidus]MBE7366808.1 hypothetical protein [Ramlibacter pallidus]
MAFSDQTFRTRTGSTGRGFASMDPERQREIVTESFRGSALRAPARPTRPFQTDWMRAQPERDTGNYEGGSSRRG